MRRICRDSAINMEAQDHSLLHSAAQSNDVEAVERLLKEGVDMYSKNKKGLTALHVLVQQRVNLLRVAQDASEERQITRNNQLAKNEKIINLLLENCTTGYDCPDFLGLTNFHVACTLQDSSIAECLSDRVVDIDQCINQDSPICAGYTPLHFACLCNISTAKMLIAKGADLLIPDVIAVTSLETCIKLYSPEELESILKSVPAWRNTVFSDGKTKLLDYILSLRNPVHHRNFLQNNESISLLSLPNDSPVWPGSTILHIAMVLVPETHIDIVRDILTANLDLIPLQDIHGSTALHLAFRRDKMKFMHLFRHVRRRKYIKDAADHEGLSHLHIAAAVGDYAIVKRLLQMKANVKRVYRGESMPTVKSGWTPLHVAVAANRSGIVEELLQSRADALQTDARGLTPIHLSLGQHRMPGLFSAPDGLTELVMEDLGLSHLHAAVWMGDCEPIEQLLDLGSDIEATIVAHPEDAKLRKFAGCRPIHVAMMNRARVATFALLLRRGADIFTEGVDRPSPLRELLTGKYDEESLAHVVESIWGSGKSQRRMTEDMGMTMLHLACYALDEKRVKLLLGKGVDVDARIRDDSSIWPGFTPLHALILAGLRVAHCQSSMRMNALERMRTLMDLMLKQKADVTVSNADGDTPVHMALRTANNTIAIQRAALLMEHHRDYSVNPVNEAGMSHFHVACLLKDTKVVENFWQNANNVDVNGAIGSSDDDRYAGQTPLMMTLSHRLKKDYDVKSQVRLVDLLLERGADVHAVDAFGDTTLHKLVCCCYRTRERLLDKILNDGRDINKRATDGKTPIEILLLAGASGDELKRFVDQGCHINSYNNVSDVGYMAIIINSSKYRTSKETGKILKMMMDLPDIADADGTGRNAIHNAVSGKSMGFMSENDYVDLFEKLKELGCDIHQKDNLGRTALHLAFKFENKEAISALLMCGIDINDQDAKGTLPSFCVLQIFKGASWYKHMGLMSSLYSFLAKCKILGLELSPENMSLSDMLLERGKFEVDVASFKQQVKETRDIKIGQRNLTAYDFLSESKNLRAYSSLLPEECKAASLIMKSLDRNRFKEVWRLFKMQCNKALDRVHLVTTAASSLNTLIGYPLPHLCLNIVLKALTNSDLRNLNKAVIEDNDLEMITV